MDLVLPATASILVVLTCLYVFYTFTSMTGILKDAVRFSRWKILFVMYFKNISRGLMENSLVYWQEESVFHALWASKWYEKSVKERKTIIFMQKESMKARRIRLFGVGDMGRYTFIDVSTIISRRHIGNRRYSNAANFATSTTIFLYGRATVAAHSSNGTSAAFWKSRQHSMKWYRCWEKRRVPMTHHQIQA